MALNDDDLLAAVSTGIDTAGAPSAPAGETTDETVDETNTGDAGDGVAAGAEGAGDGGDGADGDGAGGEQAAGDDADGAGEAGEEGEGEGRVRDPATGKFVAKKKEGESEEGKTPAVGADGKPVAKAPAAKDPVNDPIPAGLKKETQERMVSLIDTAKKLTAERDQVRGQYEEIMGYIQESRATPEQYGQALEYLSWVNSGDPAKLDKCIQFMQTELIALCKIAGKPVPGVDLLSEHPDLAQEVADGAISRQRAEEIAAARGNQQVRTNHARYTSEQDAQQQLIAHGRSELNKLEAELQANDPHYAYKKGILVESLKGVFAQVDPRKWRSTFKAAYDRLPNPAPAAKPTPRTVASTPGSKQPANQPLRARNPAGGQQAAPKSLFDAVSQGIANAG